MKPISQFLKVFTIDDVKLELDGELNEYSIDDITYFFGNKELIVITDTSETVYVVDGSRGFDELVEY
jgi:hypothetical protein